MRYGLPSLRRRFEKGSRCGFPWAAAILVVAVTAGCHHGEHESAGGEEEGSSEKHAVVSVHTVPAQRRAIEVVVHALGRCEAQPRKAASLPPRQRRLCLRPMTRSRARRNSIVM